MGLLHQSETIHPNALDSLCIKTIYNFTYRLSGNTEIAELLTEEVLLLHPGKNKDDINARTILILKEYEQLSYEEIAGIFGQTVNCPG